MEIKKFPINAATSLEQRKQTNAEQTFLNIDVMNMVVTGAVQLCFHEQ